MTLNPSISIIALLLNSFIFLKIESFSIFDFMPLILLVVLKSQNLKIYLFALLKLNLFVLVLALTMALDGRELAEILSLVIRVNSILLFTLLLFYGSSGYFVAYGLYGLYLPSRFILLIFFTLKFFYIFKDEISRFHLALKARGSRLTLMAISYMLTSLIVLLFTKIDIFKQMIFIRKLDGKLYFANKMKINFIDFAFLALVIFVFCLEILR